MASSSEGPFQVPTVVGRAIVDLAACVGFLQGIGEAGTNSLSKRAAELAEHAATATDDIIDAWEER